MVDEEPIDPPPRDSAAASLVAKGVEAGLSLVPGAGGPLSIAFAAAIGRGYNRRLYAWLEDLAAAVDDLCRAVDELTLEDLADDELFLDAVATATRAAERTSSSEKRTALRNAVLNTALPDRRPDADLAAIFLRWIDDFTPSHLRLLTHLDDPVGWFDRRPELQRPENIYMGGRMQVIGAALPEMVATPGLVDQAFKDLQAAGLTNIGGLNVTQTGASLFQPATTELGKAFIRFVTDPRDATP